MARNKVMLHIGPDPVRHADLVPHAAELSDLGHVVPPLDQEALDLAALEMLRAHKAAGLRRSDVEGRWAEVGRLAFRARTDLVISQPLLHQAQHGQVPLVLDALAGLDVHVMLTSGSEDDSLRAPWVRDLGPFHVHTMAAPTDAGDPARLARDTAALVARIRDDALRRKRDRSKRVRNLIPLGAAS